jgi:hypothetical protein
MVARGSVIAATAAAFQPEPTLFPRIVPLRGRYGKLWIPKLRDRQITYSIG